MSKAIYEKKSKTVDTDNLQLETLDVDENNDGELLDCVDKAKRPENAKQHSLDQYVFDCRSLCM